MPVLSYLALGSNLGNRFSNLKKSVKCLNEGGLEVIAVSKFYETAPLKAIKQGKFLNAVLKVKTSLGPLELLKLCKRTEKKLKRKKSVKWGPRTIDVDILLYGKRRIRLRNLSIPHRELSKRPFVLRPLLDVAPAGRHPVTGVSYKKLLQRTGSEGKILKVWKKRIAKNT